jgi:hypothetical protein
MSFLKKYKEEELSELSHPDGNNTYRKLPPWWCHSRSRCCKIIK